VKLISRYCWGGRILAKALIGFNYKAKFALKQHLICGAKLAYVHYIYLFSFFVGHFFSKLAPNFYKWGAQPPSSAGPAWYENNPTSAQEAGELSMHGSGAYL